jgi:hypothetical protein
MKIDNRLIRLTIVVVCCAFQWNCNNSASESQPSPGMEPRDKKLTEEPPNESSFDLSASVAGPYHIGEKSRFAIVLLPRGDYHINQQFPTSVTITAPKTLSIEKTQLVKTDASEFTEQRAKFDIPFSSSEKGEHQLDARVSFAVCTSKTCVPFQKNLTVTVKVD